MPVSDVILRPCPVCGDTELSCEYSADPEIFAKGNHTYDIRVLDQLNPELKQALTIGQCANCDMIYSTAQLSDGVIEKVYDELIDWHKSLAKVRPDTIGLAEQRVIGAVQAVFGDNGPGDARILDFGCGWGQCLTALHDLGATNILGCEMSKPRLAHLKEKAIPAKSCLKEVQTKGPFELIIMHHSLEHLYDVKTTLSTVCSLLAPKGRLYVSVPDARQMFESTKGTCLRPSQTASKDVNPWEHVNYFTQDTLIRILNDAGMIVETLLGTPPGIVEGIIAKSSPAR